tara:strand:+ start:75 stop:383 length:309 start_codon:yes stop_codon:yes gene_type:complete
MKIGTKKKHIYEWLVYSPEARDDDNYLIAEIWKEEIGVGIHEMDAHDVLCMLAMDRLTSPESIRRTRQKIQQENPNLRGEKYKARHKEQEQVKQELINWNNE